MLTLAGAEILQVEIPLKHTFRHALAARSKAESVIVRVTDTDGRVGSGECAPREYVTGETSASVTDILARTLPAFVGREWRTFVDVRARLDVASHGLPRNEHAAFCALELALLDLAGRAFGVCAGDVLGPVVTPHVEYSGVVSADGAVAARKLCEQMRQFGLRSVKVKVGGSLAEDLQVLRVARDVLGPGCSLRADANCAWTPDEALERIAAFAPLRLDGLEQPVAAADLDGMARLTARSPIPIIADESLVSVADAEQLAARRACHLFNIRVSKCGGLINAARIHAVGHAAGIGCMLGAQVGETAILSAAGRHFAARVAGVRFCEGSYGKLLLEQDLATQDVTFGSGGVAPALTGPGLGVDVDPQRLAAFVRARRAVASA